MASQWRTFSTAMGPAAVVVEGSRVVQSYLPGGSRSRLRQRVQADHPGAREAPRGLVRLVQGLQAYYAGTGRCPPASLALEGVTDFAGQVYETLRREVPAGETITHGDLARRVGSPAAARAVGGALARNPFAPLVPCHRVVGARGSLGGFSGPGGTRLKARLLSLEARSAARRRT